MRKYANISAPNIVLDEKSKAELMRSEQISEDEILEPLKLLPGYIKDIRQYKLITPLFGGGVETHECDPIGIIRETEIRGQLRFWWRACRSGQYASYKEMKEAEDAIWGSAHTTKEEQENSEKELNKTIQIRVEVKNPQKILKGAVPAYVKGKDEKDKDTADINTNANIPEYAAFPLKPAGKDIYKQQSEWAKVYPGIEFTLTIQYPLKKETAKEVEAAIWAWETFGGVGARTRRGFGALQLVKSQLQPELDRPKYINPQSIGEWINRKLKYYVEGTNILDDVPRLSRSPQYYIHIPPKTKGKLDSAIQSQEAWKNLIEFLQDFRQAKKNRKSQWPDKKHAQEVVSTGATDATTFPKTNIGLPIVFQFENKTNNITIQGGDEGKERFASPLIIRPLAWSSEEVPCGLALLLEGTNLPDKLQIIGPQKKEDLENKICLPSDPYSKLTPDQAKEIPVLQENTDVKQELFNTIKIKSKRYKGRY